jgi:putative proteasome-type protease
MTAPNLFEAARCVGDALRELHRRDAGALKDFGVDFNASLTLGGQIRGEPPRLFSIYSAGNFIEATRETCYFQVGESKYGKPVLDRMITPHTALDEAAKCALVSMDSTLKSNLSVGLPLDLLVYETDTFQSHQMVCIDEHNPYFTMIRSTWGQRLRQVFESIDDPQWDGSAAEHPLCVPSDRYEPMRKITHPGEKII